MFRKAGIAIIGPEWRKPVQAPLFEISIQYGAFAESKGSYSVEMHLIEEVVLVRDPEIRIEAVTWKYGPRTGTAYIDGEPAPESGAERYIREGIYSFISSYRFDNRPARESGESFEAQPLRDR